MLESYRDLHVWQRAIDATLAVYRLSATFPKEETFGLTSQMRRAAVAVASSIAEGYGRNTPGEYKQLLGRARGSNLELQTYLVLAAKLNYAAPEKLAEVEALSTEVAKMLNSMINKL